MLRPVRYLKRNAKFSYNKKLISLLIASTFQSLHIHPISAKKCKHLVFLQGKVLNPEASHPRTPSRVQPSDPQDIHPTTTLFPPNL